MSLTFWVPGKPVGYDRASAHLRFTPEDVAVWRRDVQVCYLAATGYEHPKDGEYTGFVKMELAAYGAAADVDNIAKEVMDALKGSAYRDDAQVKWLKVETPDRELTAMGRPKKNKNESQGIRVVLTFLGMEERQ